ncbi:MAG: sigma-54-dependent Fis family transcriptional regulator [Deltaproteobacteria bacterium]|nr:sigma-54-dependent Fis family transcriptional regulator [Deltaproteobacteria bacterium]MDQ3297509.1 sigma-54-dependent Fis family transcriptional regulator [Myxococcota bacterium]
MTDVPALIVVITGRGAHPLRHGLAKQITSIGSDATADVRLAIVPAHWAIIHRGEQTIDVLMAATGERRRLDPGESFDADGITIGLEAMASARERERAIEALVSALASVDSPEGAVELLLTGMLGASGADLGAVILADAGAYTVAAARDRAGTVLEHASELLSDTIVRDVLGTGEPVQLDDVAAHSRYGTIPSVTALRLGSALCLPMRLEGKTLGAVFLARHDRSVIDERTLAALRILAAVAVPFFAQLRAPRADAGSRDELIGESPAVHALRKLIRRVGPSDLSALLHGPSGSGKELVARAIHAASPRAARPMISINCASVAPSLLDAELFGYRKGAFTGAVTDRVGLIEAAHGSTLFLDEIGDMPPTMQAAMLRVLEQREVKRLGDNLPRAVDFRLVCATHRDLEAEVEAGRFRADLLFRLREVTLEIPSLLARGEDIDLLAHAFLRQAEVQLGLVMHVLTDDALAVLRAHPWPGNVRELKATMRRVAILADSKLVRASDLGLAAAAADRPASAASPLGGAAAAVRELIEAAIRPGASVQPLATLRDELVRRYVLLAIERHGDDREAAAKALEIGVRTLYRYIS